MDLTHSPADEAFRAEARDWLAAHVPSSPLPSLETAEGFAAHRAWEQTLHDGGYAMVSWPVEYGGRGCNLIEWLIFEEEYWRSGAPGRVSQNGIFLLAPIIFDHGTPEQQARFLPSMGTGEVIWAQAWSEPEAGSDDEADPSPNQTWCLDCRCHFAYLLSPMSRRTTPRTHRPPSPTAPLPAR